MRARPAEGSIHARLVKDHDDLDEMLESLIAAFKTGDWEAASATYADFEGRLTTHLRGEEELFFPDFAIVDPAEVAELREEHRKIRERVFELGVGIDLHQTRIGAILELADMLRRHAAREDAVLYPWANEAFAAAQASRFFNFFTHGRSPVAPVQS
jgi:hemerythrin-like domain-containing protein